MNYTFCNLILKKQLDINFYKLLYNINNIQNVKLSKNFFVFNRDGINVKIFVNGIITLTGIKLKNISQIAIKDFTKNIDDFLIDMINKPVTLLNKKKFNEFYLCDEKFLLNQNNDFVGLIKDGITIINNIKVKPITIDNQIYHISYNNNDKYKKLFKNGILFGTLKFDLFNSKYFFNNSSINIDYNTQLIYSKNKLIGNIKVEQKNYFLKKPDLSNFYSIVSCNIKFNIGKTINRYSLFNNLVKKGYICEFKIFSSSSINIFIDNISISVFKSGYVIIKGISNKSSISNFYEYVYNFFNIISSNL